MLVHNFGPIAIAEEQLFGALEQIQREVGRLDGEAVCEFHRRVDGEAIARRGSPPPGLLAAWRDDCARHDALPAGASALPRDLEFIRARELEQIRRPLNSDLFPVDRSVPIGAREHTYRRRVGRGEAVVTRGDTENYGHARTGRVEQKFPVIYLVSSVRQTYFETLSSDYAGIQQYAADLRMAYRVVDERKNGILWNGHAPTGVYGALNFPGLMKKVMSVTFGGASTSNFDTLARAVHERVDTPADLSGEAMQPNTLVVSPKIYRHMAHTKDTDGSGVTLLQFILAGQDATNGIRRVVKAAELAGIGPNGEDGMFAFADDLDALSNIEVMPTMTMPVYQASALSYLTLVVAAIGGVTMPNAGNNILGLANVG